MSQDRPPIKRPSVAGIVGDNAGRVRGLEAAQTMPYCWGLCQFDWLEDVCVDWMEDWAPSFGQSCVSTTFPQWDASTADGTVQWFTTDPSIFAPVSLSPLQDPDNETVGGINVSGGGLFWWFVDVEIFTDSILPDNPITSAYWWDGASFALNPEVGLQVQPRSGNFYGSSDQGIRSVTGYRDGEVVTDGSQPPEITPKLTVQLYKGTDTNVALSYQVSVVIVRWSPVGFFDQV